MPGSSDVDAQPAAMARASQIEPAAPGAEDALDALVADWRESGWLPGWSVGPGQTKVSPGDPAAPAIASIHALGAGSFDQGVSWFSRLPSDQV